MGEMISVDAEYLNWISSVTEKFKQSQIKAASKVNTEMLRFYFNLGSEISSRDKENKYGSSFYKRISDDLQRELPDVRSFSATNLKYMTYFYELYADVVNRPQVVDESKVANRPQVADDFTEPIFLIPWGHNRLIIAFKGATELTYDMAHAFIEKIIVYRGDRLEIIWRFKNNSTDDEKETL